MLDRVICSREQFSFQMCLESGDGSERDESVVTPSSFNVKKSFQNLFYP